MKKTFNHKNTLMVQGTTSDAGKSVLVAALCRILVNAGISTAPFKSQNMALNSAVAADGGEIGRAQAVQAQACKLEPSIRMNPVLLKPNSDLGSQVIVNGQAIGNMKAREYHVYKPKLLELVAQAHDSLANDFQAVLVEGAGSPAEINLREHDIANMGFAEKVDCPVVIVADIDRGGVFAHLYGTFALLSETEQARVVGFVINRFRGDVSLLQSGLDWLEAKTGVPTLAVIPYIHNLHIEAEDSITQRNETENSALFKIRMPKYPRASNHTDFDVLTLHPEIDCAFVSEIDQWSDKKHGADLIILPGSKNVRGDLAWLKANGWDKLIKKHLRYGGKVIGICGGFQMLGDLIHDPEAIESTAGSSTGLGLLTMQTTLTDNKTLRNVEGHLLADSKVGVKGYEIHAGVSKGKDLDRAVFVLSDNALDVRREALDVKEELNISRLTSNLASASFKDGAINADNTVLGTYVHGVFDQPELLDYLLNWAGFEAAQTFDYPAFRDAQIERLASEVEKVWPLDQIKKLIDL